MTMLRDALAHSIQLHGDGEAVRQLHDGGLALADEATMSQAIHEVYCGPDADLDQPSEKDRAQARSLMSALQHALAAMYPA
jgi:hypothetical protein